MRITILCRDTRGGVQPYAALALGLKTAGHAVTAVAPAELLHLFSSVGIPGIGLSGNDEIDRMAEMGLAELSSGARRRFMRVELPRQLANWTREAFEACEGADVVTGGVGGMVIGLSAADKLRVPFVETHLQPIGAPTGLYPGVLAAALPSWMGAFGRRLSHHVSDRALWMMFAGVATTARRDVLGLDGQVRFRAPRLRVYGFSPRVVPLPPDPLHRPVGYWTLPLSDGWAPPQDLLRFLAGPGPPLVCVGFGSMVGRDPTALTALVVGAVKDAGLRAVLLGGWGGLKPPDDPALLYLDQAPHEWLFSRMAAVVHHGGAGTTAAGLRAGVPSVVVPFAVDQPFWASRVAALGVGPKSIPRRQLTRARLADALRTAVGDTAIATRAKILGDELRAERGVEAAVEIIEAHLHARQTNAS